MGTARTSRGDYLCEVSHRGSDRSYSLTQLGRDDQSRNFVVFAFAGVMRRHGCSAFLVVAISLSGVILHSGSGLHLSYPKGRDPEIRES
ncbi:hypothetical protein DAEQUDRAFT_724220 [Daedalea quercina L-15889]|uniref:Uncharacterized protein n=1 Tax=Daedalea quercina L-15889 TaxID=1314783 RepID=A0A165RXE3_9APHY|nr:hypothetical protein DAEQUDRAFT_724220 [Daedalea quercina L-15889]